VGDVSYGGLDCYEIIVILENLFYDGLDGVGVYLYNI
jgi:hypothetical protein